MSYIVTSNIERFCSFKNDKKKSWPIPYVNTYFNYEL